MCTPFYKLAQTLTHWRMKPHQKLLFLFLFRSSCCVLNINCSGLTTSSLIFSIQMSPSRTAAMLKICLYTLKKFEKNHSNFRVKWTIFLNKTRESKQWHYENRSLRLYDKIFMSYSSIAPKKYEIGVVSYILCKCR